MRFPTRLGLLLICLSWAGPQAMAGCGLSAIDHKLAYNDSGIWKRSNQLARVDAMLATSLGGALWEGGEW
jgi:hypothetical protein